MIKVESLTIFEFRGIRELTLSLNRKNFAVCGPNGTGKSGVVDALEFVLAGTISRLTGKGRGDLSVKGHGAHVDCQEAPDKAFVEAVVWIPSLCKSVTARRTVKAPSSLKLTPDSAEARAVFRQLEAHPEIALSRREIIRFVLAEPGQRAKDVQALLKLDELEALRTRLQKIANALEVTRKRAVAELDTAGTNLARAMDIAGATDRQILEAANRRRCVVGLAPLQALASVTSLREGLPTPESNQASRVNKAVAKVDVAAAVVSLRSRSEEPFSSLVAEAKAAICALQVDQTMLSAVVGDDFLKTALELYDGEVCPACDTPKSLEEFGAIIGGKRSKLQSVKTLRERAERAIAPVYDALEADLASARSIYPHAKHLLDETELKFIANHGTALKVAGDALKALLPLDATLGILLDLAPSPAIISMLGKLEALIGALPEPSEKEAAQEYLITAQPRLDMFRTARAAAMAAEDRATRARTVLEVYKSTSDAALEAVYANVQNDFANLYRRINADDEGAFEAKLAPSSGKLGFGVDFYGRGFFPPGAYHSEGHQDSMGLCLYLALMRHLLGGGFTFVVLDDVLMSVDAGHRREVSKLLRAEFPATQFVLTIHDKAWLKFMSTTKLVDAKDTVHFRKWTVADGPTIWAKGDVWAEIRALAGDDEIPGAASLLRRSLEHLSSEFCQALRVRVEFSVDGHHGLGDLLDPAISQLKSLYREARLSADSWKDADRVASIQLREKAFDEAVALAKFEQWQINPSVHYNEWANLQKDEILAVVDAFQRLCGLFECDACGPIEVSPGRGSREFIQCLCGKIRFSFMKNPKAKQAA
ncbi:AAA family ATPase [Methylobacterium sp. 37f]|uniref:AAA family ATPase n=1 Tax=Methylobacterium sp. 37f TaxID=2817058 RepID=UPI001FFC2FAF|nr:AAA family ATPase [Methylobacterium sp. 37f]MCK2056251.1 AAA family ATPase [Methylobacterium sp. 37f]